MCACPLTGFVAQIREKHNFCAGSRRQPEAFVTVVCEECVVQSRSYLRLASKRAKLPSGLARAAMLRFSMYAFIRGLLACTLPYLPCISAYAPVYPFICFASESVEGRKESE